jgi:hypothetical protein
MDTLSAEERQIVEAATRLARAAGLTVDDLPDIAVERQGEGWVVSFTHLAPSRIGGPGFQITMDATREKALKILRYQ